MKIGIIGTRGIPNRYGGFEQLAENLSVALVENGHEVIVYNTQHHPYKEKTFKRVSIIHCQEPLWLGTAGQFIYDLNCILHARRVQPDILLFLGYTSSSVWYHLFPKKTIILCNMDGLEWKRQKYSWITRRFLMLAERWAALHSDHLIADSPVIQHYLSEKFRKTSRYIPYGAEINIQEDISVLDQWGLKRNGFYLLIARMEPENNIEMILDGFDGSNDPGRFMVVGDTANRFGQRMRKKYVHNPHIIFMDAIYEPAALFTLRKNACIYFHGHSVGGTNPSLLEAMAARVLIAAHDNEFNRAVLSDDAYYFKNSSDITRLLKDPAPVSTGTLMKENNFSKITEQFNWPRVSEKYELFFIQCLSQR